MRWECEMSLMSSCVSNLDSQLESIFGKAMEPLADPCWKKCITRTGFRVLQSDPTSCSLSLLQDCQGNVMSQPHAPTAIAAFPTMMACVPSETVSLTTTTTTKISSGLLYQCIISKRRGRGGSKLRYHVTKTSWY